MQGADTSHPLILRDGHLDEFGNIHLHADLTPHIGQDIPVTVVIYDKDGNKIGEESGTITVLAPTDPSTLLITAIRVIGDDIEIDAKGLRNWSKQYTIFGSPVLLTQTAAGNVEINEPIRHTPTKGGIDTHTFRFKKQPGGEDACFFHLRELK